MRKLFAALLLLPSLAWATYNSTISADAPCHWYHMDAASGTVESDIIAFGSGCASGAKDGTYSATGITLNQTGITGAGTDKAAAFDGASGTTMDANGGSNDFMPAVGNNVGWSVEVWVKTSAAGNVVFGGGTYPTSYGWFFYIDAGKLDFTTKQSNCSSDHGISDTGSGLTDGSYHHVVITTLGNGSGDIQHFITYKDGSQVANFTGFTGTTICQTAGAFSLANLTNTNRLTGTIDEVAFYNTELTSTRVLAHYTAGITAPIVDVHKNRPFTSKRDEWRERLLYPATLIERGAPSISVDAPTFVLDRLNRRAIRAPEVYAQ